MDMAGSFLFFLALFLFKRAVEAQPGFISIDCGIPNGVTYKEDGTRINYVSDFGYIDTGVNRNISTELNTDTLPQQLGTLRSFPQGVRNCYALKPVTKGTKYLIRATFMYGNYDGEKRLPQFDLYLGPNQWGSVNVTDMSRSQRKEIITMATMELVWFCLVNVGLGTPFVSILEVRPLDDTMYRAVNESRALSVFSRLDAGAITNNRIRYEDDVYDRIWIPFISPSWASLSTFLPVNNNYEGFEPPSAVMKTAAVPLDKDQPLNFFWDRNGFDPDVGFFIYFHFAELVQLNRRNLREFNISINHRHNWFGPYSPDYLSSDSVYSDLPFYDQTFNISIYKTSASLLPPILNALEIYTVDDFLETGTHEQDVKAMMEIKEWYGVKRNWMGDPCVPKDYTWKGLNCNYPDLNGSRIISLDLSSTELEGEISPSFANLTAIQSLDLSRNTLSGQIPEFLADLPFLKSLNLTNNLLNGSIPVKILERSKSGQLLLSVDDGLCSVDYCKNDTRTPVSTNANLAPRKLHGNIFLALIVPVTLALFQFNM